MRRVGPLRSSDPAWLGRYRVVGRLGAGGQGVVYLARDPVQAERLVAIKTFHADLADDRQAAARFVKELAAARRVAAFCTAQVLDADVNPDEPYIVSEYVDGPSLQQAVSSDGPRTGNTLHRLAIATATALEAIHEASIVHRDFKPHNVLLGPDGPRVIDFGIARALDGTTTTTNRAIGTPAYMAPEQIAGRLVGPPADVFAWGGVMVFAATGRPAFGNDSIPAIMERVLRQEPELGDLDGPLRDLVQHCLTKDPAARPTARQLHDRLLGVPGTAPESKPVTDAPRPATRAPYADAPPALPSPPPLSRSVAETHATRPPRRVSRRTSLRLSRRGWIALAVPVMVALATLPLWLVGSTPAAGRVLSIGQFGAYSGVSVAVGQLRDSTIALTVSGGRLRVWDLATGKQLRGLDGTGTGTVTSVAMGRLAGATVALAGTERGAVRVWDLATRRQLGSLTGHADSVDSVAITQLGGRTVVLADSLGTVRVWDLAARTQINRIEGRATGPAHSVAATRLGGTNIALFGGADGSVQVWDLETHTQSGSLTSSGRAVLALAVGQLDGTPAALAADYDNSVRVWNLATRQQIGKLTGHTGPVYSVAVTQLDGEPVAVSGGADNTVRVWDPTTRQQTDTFTGHTGAVDAVAVTQLEGEPVAVSAGRDGTVRVWNLDHS